VADQTQNERYESRPTSRADNPDSPAAEQITSSVDDAEMPEFVEKSPEKLRDEVLDIF